MDDIIDNICFHWFNGHKLETKLAAYQGYRHDTIIKWKRQTDLSWPTISKLLSNFEIYTGPKIRSIIKKIVIDNEHIFSQHNCFITGFGNTGKSGDVILYEFSHTTNINQPKFKKTCDLLKLPTGSTIIFVEDMIGTGTQSLDYIQSKATQVLLPSHKPYLLTLCATTSGVKKIMDNTNFEVLAGVLLDEEHQHYSENSKLFTKKEKMELLSANNQLKSERSFDFDLGLLIAFYFTIPNNVMPIFWKDDYIYNDKKGNEKKWMALLPRYF